MTHLKLAMAAVLALSVTACDRFKKDDPVDEIPVTTGSDAQNGTTASGTDAGTSGTVGTVTTGALDPNSVAYFKETIGDRVLFKVDQSNLTPEGAAILDKQAAWLLERPNMDVLIEGHADEQGTREYNLALGARRASSVLNYLVSKGIPVTRIKTVTYGKERPIEVCSSEACWAKNRRAVTVVAGGLNS